MKHLKTFALAAVAAGALMAFVGAGTASATTLCSTTVTTCPSAQTVTGALTFTLASGTKVILKETGTFGFVLDECEISTLKDEITNRGGSTETVTGPITSLTWGGCIYPTTTTLKGKLEIHKIAGTSNGTVAADLETKVTINTVFFGSCVYTIPSGESFGDLTEGNPAILHLNAVAHKLPGSEAVCPTTANWVATYTLTSPATTVSVAEG